MKGFLSERGVSYVERDVMEDEAALRELEELGVMTTPVVRVGDEVVVGFDRARLSALLGLDLPPTPSAPCCCG
ncbi:MAG: glutaredoxin family protein [Thermoflexales bacterium]|nr:glutaredoxin family protein [Thermoflexales bacterium]